MITIILVVILLVYKLSSLSISEYRIPKTYTCVVCLQTIFFCKSENFCDSKPQSNYINIYNIHWLFYFWKISVWYQFTLFSNSIYGNPNFHSKNILRKRAVILWWFAQFNGLSCLNNKKVTRFFSFSVLFFAFLFLSSYNSSQMGRPLSPINETRCKQEHTKVIGTLRQSIKNKSH